jgi:hypothetical protein
MSRKLPGTILDPNTSISISSIAVDGATIQIHMQMDLVLLDHTH